MNLLNIVVISILFLQAPGFSAAEDAEDRQHFQKPGETDVPEIEITDHPTPAPSDIPTLSPTDYPSSTPSAKPSLSPSAHPSSSPSTKPTSAPSHSPSLSPSTSPTVNPSTKPTTAPSGTPTLHPSFVPSAVPSQTPSDAPTTSPSVAPSMYPSFVPSDMPSSVPSVAPTKADCESKDGSFGDFPSEDAIVKYSYEVELGSIMDADAVQENVLPDLENGIVDSILPTLFTDDCGHSLTTRRLRVQRRLSEVKGISKYPEDLIYDNYACASVAAGNSCYVVSGELTIFAEDEATLSTETENVEKAIQNEMDAGSLNDSQEDIVRVSYVEIDPQANNVEDTPRVNDDDNRVLTISPVPFIIGGAVLLAVMIGIAYRQHRKSTNSDLDESQIGGSQVQSQPQPNTEVDL